MVLAYVVIAANYIINEQFLWKDKDGRTYLQILHFAVTMNLITSARYTFVEGTQYAGVVMGIILFTMAAMQEITYAKKSKGLANRLAWFVLMLLVFVALICVMHPVMW